MRNVILVLSWVGGAARYDVASVSAALALIEFYDGTFDCAVVRSESGAVLYRQEVANG